MSGRSLVPLRAALVQGEMAMTVKLEDLTISLAWLAPANGAATP
jgi:hypothetical protein